MARNSNDRVISDAEWNSAVSSLSTVISGPDAVNIATQYLHENGRGGTRYNQRARTGVERSQDKPEAIPSLVMHIVAQESLHYGPELRV
jgi:hypothetical protein